MSRSVSHDGRRSLQVRFPYDRDLVDRIKRLPHRRWNAGERLWSVPDTDVVELVELLAPAGFRFDEATIALYREHGGRLDPEPGPATPLPGLFDETAEPPIDASLTVSALNERVRELLRGGFPEAVWVVGEISGFNKSAHRRHVSFELVERDPRGETLSRLPAVLFASSRETIERALSEAGEPFRLEDEVEVRLKVRVDLYVPWGQYRAVIEELDVRFTLGEAARRREEIVRRLGEAGLLERNPALPVPPWPLRVGLVTSLGSDAYNDVMRTLQESGYAFDVTVHGARVQGRSTEPSVLNALDWFRARTDRFDVLVICRGGGSRTDLIGFDSETLGRAVATFPLPVLIGIGHEQDRSVLDAVARSCKTPTAAAAWLVERVDAARRHLIDRTFAALAAATRRIASERSRHVERAARLTRAARQHLRRERTALDHRRQRTAQATRAAVRTARAALARWTIAIPSQALRHLQRGRDRVDQARNALQPVGRRRLERERERLGERERRLRLGDPRRVVERGYAILRDGDGRVVTTPAAAPPGCDLLAELRGGRLRLRSGGPATPGPDDPKGEG